mmetsp:Transcript_114623/g.286519  ORF Transcript_114623/g.286519 Transcript_114623/m.286519 type:complete len:108 (+) Transcript_114623:169-492(+)
MAPRPRATVLAALLLAAAVLLPAASASTAADDEGAAVLRRRAPAGGLKVSSGRSYEPLDESLREAFLDAIENDEETKALSEELSKRYKRRAAKYVIKGNGDAIDTSV